MRGFRIRYRGEFSEEGENHYIKADSMSEAVEFFEYKYDSCTILKCALLNEDFDINAAYVEEVKLQTDSD